MPSVRDVAARAGVSVATVSRVLNGSEHPVTRETQDLVLKAAEELAFFPNLLARGLVTSKTHTIGAIVHDIADPYFGAIVRGLEDGARSGGYRIFVCSSSRDSGRELNYVESLLSHRVDAIVFVGGGIEEHGYQRRLRTMLAAYAREGGVVVRLAPSALSGPHVRPDNEGGAYTMTRYLMDLGHRRIAFVSGPPHIRTSGVRLAGYRRALIEGGLDPDPGIVVPGHFSGRGGAEAAAALLDRGLNDVTAIFAANDVTAFGVIQELRRQGLDLPNDMSVAGFDNVEFAGYVNPSLTTVRIPMWELGSEGVAMALRLIDGERPRSRVLATEIVERESTTVPRTV